MKVLLAATSDDVQTGASHCYLDIVREFKKRNIDFVSLVPKSGDLSEFLENMGVKTYIVKDQVGAWQVNSDYQMSFINYLKYLVKCVYNFFAVNKAKRIIKREKIDIVHVNSLSRCTAAKAAYELNVPYVWHIRELLEDGLKSKFVNKDEAIKLLNNAEKVVCISKTVEDYYVSRYGLSNTVVIYDGVDVDKFYCKRDILNSDKIKIGIIGRVDEQKRQNVFIDAIIQLYREYKNIECYIVGGYYDDDYYHNLVNKIKDNNLENVVHFTGFVERPEEYIKKCDIVCVCSYAEAFGLTTIEAMLSRALVIASDSGANSELIEDGKNGLLYACDDIEDLHIKIDKVIHDKHTANEISRRGQESALNYTVLDSVSNLENTLYCSKRSK